MGRKTRKDARVDTLEKKIEREQDLPEGSVKIVNPSGKDARGDKKVGTLREDYEYNE